MKINVIWFTIVFVLTRGAAFSFGQNVSEEARRYFDRGLTAMERAKSGADFEAAIKEFEQAARLAPGWPDAFYNLGLAREGAKKYGDAVISYREYLRLAPNASDAEEVKSLINKLEAKKDEAREVRKIFEIMTANGYERKLMESDKPSGRGLPFPASEGFRMVSGEMQVRNYWYASDSYHPQSHPPIPREWEPVTVSEKNYEYSYSYYMDSVITRTDPFTAYVTRHDVEVKGEIISIDPPRIKELVTDSCIWGAPIEGNTLPWSSDFNDTIEEENIYELVIRNVNPKKPTPRDNSEDEVNKLIAEAGGINGKDKKYGATPLHFARSKDVADLLIAKGADINAPDNNGNTPLHWAAGNARKEVTELLIAKGLAVNAQGINGGTPLHWATGAEVAELLIAKGADINAKDKDGGTPLHWAAGNGKKDVAALLISKGANINAKSDKDGGTPLHWAAGNGKKEAAELLIAKGADINAKNNYGNAPLHVAAWNNRTEAAELLIAKGADVNAKNNFDETPLQCAVSKGFMEVADLLRKHGAK